MQWPEEILAESFGAAVTTETGKLLFRGLCVRMGVHMGQPTCTEDPVIGRRDYFGPMVNRRYALLTQVMAVNLLSAEVLQSDERLDVIKFIDLGVYRLWFKNPSLFQIQPELSERIFRLLELMPIKVIYHTSSCFCGTGQTLDWLTHLLTKVMRR